VYKSSADAIITLLNDVTDRVVSQFEIDGVSARTP
jgi:hypothetical protein